MPADLVNPASLRRHLDGWAERGAGPGYRRLSLALRQLILDGRLPLGRRLPSERQLADELGTSRTLVTAALDELRADGFLTSRQGSGTVTSHPHGPASREVGLLTRSEQAGVLDFAAAALPASEHVHAAYTRALELLPAYLPRHGYEHVGLIELRAVIARRYTEAGLLTDPDQVLVAAGAQNAFALLLRAYARPGRSVLMEQPTYPHAIDAVVQAGYRARPAPLLRDGWDRDALLAAARGGADALTYLVPDHQNPTGLVMDAGLRRALAAEFQTGERLLVLDETLADLWFDAPPPAPDPSMDGAGVVRLGSLAKSFWGGLRLGWMRADRRVIDAVARIRTTLDLGVPVLEQLAAAHLLATEDDGLPERRRLLRARRDLLLSLIGEALPDWSAPPPPPGGLTLWLEMPRPVAVPLAAACERAGVRLAAGPRFGIQGGMERFLRLPFTRPEPELRTAVSTIAAAYRTCGDKRVRADAAALKTQAVY